MNNYSTQLIKLYNVHNNTYSTLRFFLGGLIKFEISSCSMVTLGQSKFHQCVNYILLVNATALGSLIRPHAVLVQ